MTDLPADAITAAENAIRARYTITGPDVDRRVAFVMGDVRAALEAAVPAIRAQAAAAERERLIAEQASGEFIGSRQQQAIHDAYQEGAAAERERFLAVLVDHFLAGIECDHERKLDNPVCGCSRVFLGWHPSIGAARQAWIDHVAGLLEAEP